MPERETRQRSDKNRNIIDYLFYALAGGVLVALSFSFLLWLRF
jgi:hypothetical protein